jgi:RHS repeat-associated protein
MEQNIKLKNNNLNLKRIHNPEGYFADNNYHYYRRDHLGNNREVWNATANATVQKTQYYSSGLPWATNIGDNAGLQPYKYNGKEFIEMHGLDEYYSNFRNYYATIGRTTTQDAHAESYYAFSPYAWVGNRFTSAIDPDGKDWYEDDDGNAIWRKSQEKEYTANNKTWKNIGTEYLLFDGEKLHYFQQQENKNGDITGLTAYSYDAVSGRAQEDGTFSYTEENQTQKNTGPIPSGLYSINPQEIQKWNDLSMANKLVSTLGIRGSFQGGTYAWGDERVWINPQSVKVTNPITGEDVQRDNFSIHGGAAPGSAGCIDLHRNAPAFFKRLSQSNSSYIRLNVLYTPYNKSSQIWRKK